MSGDRRVKFAHCLFCGSMIDGSRLTTERDVVMYLAMAKRLIETTQAALDLGSTPEVSDSTWAEWVESGGEGGPNLP